MPRITLCMIVRDEEAMLSACLDSVAAAVDEMVVVDTGSQDATVAIARSAGAKVVHFPWCDDFAAARNAALPHATGEWILVLDADERLVPGSDRILREAVDTARFDCGVLPLLNAARLDATPRDILSGRERSGEPVLLPRLVRRTPCLRWRGRVHESVDVWLKSRGCRVARIDCPILHYGAVPELRLERGKAERNLALLERRCAEEPALPSPFVYLAIELNRAGQHDRAFEASQRAWSNLCAVLQPFEDSIGRIRVDGLPSIEGPGCLLAAQLVGRGAASDALEVIEKAERWGARHPNLLLVRGTAFEFMALTASGEARRRLLARAAGAFRATLSMYGEVFIAPLMPGVTSWATCTRLGVVRLLQERFTHAYACFEVALQDKGDHLEARLGLAEACIGRDDWEKALSLLTCIDATIPDVWLLTAAAQDSMGDRESATKSLKQAVALADKGLFSLHRLSLLQELARRVHDAPVEQPAGDLAAH